MKKILAGLFIILFLCLPGNIFAQSPTPSTVFDFSRAYQDFIFSYDQYKTAENEYEIARAQYIQSQTLASKSKAQEATYKMLQARDEVVKTYLTALRQRIAESVGVTQDRKDILYSKIDIEVAWYITHKNNTSSAASLEDLEKDSKTASARNTQITEPIAYEILSEIVIGKEYFLRQKQLSIITSLKNKVAEIRQNGDLPTDTMERDILEIENRQARSIGKEEEAKKLQLNIIKPKDKTGPVPHYNQIVFRISEAVQYLKEANTYLKEIVQRIKRT